MSNKYLKLKMPKVNSCFPSTSDSSIQKATLSTYLLMLETKKSTLISLVFCYLSPNPSASSVSSTSNTSWLGCFLITATITTLVPSAIILLLACYSVLFTHLSFPLFSLSIVFSLYKGQKNHLKLCHSLFNAFQ